MGAIQVDRDFTERLRAFLSEVTHGIRGQVNKEVLHAVQGRSGVVAGWAVAAVGFSVPISTTLEGVLVVLALMAWTLSGRIADLPGLVRQNRLLLLLPGLFAILAVGTIHGEVPFAARLKYLWKYDDLLLPLVFVPLFLDQNVRHLGLWGFGVAMALTLLLSLLIAAGWKPPGDLLHGIQSNATVFRHQITHNLLMAFAALLFALVALRQDTPWKRYGFALLAFCAVIDVFMLVRGRTGQLVSIALILSVCGKRFGLKGLFAGVGAAMVLVGISYLLSPMFHSRIQKALSEIEQAQVQEVAPETSAVGLRLEWYGHTISLIATHPFIGIGTGSFSHAYAEFVTDSAAVKPPHPHNQYMLMASDLGIGGALLLFTLFGILWWNFRASTGNMYVELAQGAVITLAIGCVLNSLLIDHTEGLLFSWMVSMGLAAQMGDLSREAC